MMPLTVLMALAAMTLLIVASVRHVPEGQVYTFRRMGGHIRMIGAGTHLVLPLLERVSRRIRLTGDTTEIDGLSVDGQAFRGTLYFQVIDPERAEDVIEQVEDSLHQRTRDLFRQPTLPETTDSRRAWLKHALNQEFRGKGVLVTRVELKAAELAQAA